MPRVVSKVLMEEREIHVHRGIWRDSEDEGQSITFFSNRQQIEGCVFKS